MASASQPDRRGRPKPDVTVGDQYSDRDIYNILLQQRDSLLRDIAGTRTRARWAIVAGVVLLLGGGAVFVGGALRFLASLADAVRSGSVPDVVDPFGVDVAGIPSGLIGFVVASIGGVLMIVGIVMHVIASARRNQVYRDLQVLGPR